MTIDLYIILYNTIMYVLSCLLRIYLISNLLDLKPLKKAKNHLNCETFQQKSVL